MRNSIAERKSICVLLPLRHKILNFEGRQFTTGALFILHRRNAGEFLESGESR